MCVKVPILVVLRPSENQMTCLNPLFRKCGWRVGGLSNELGVSNRTFARIMEDSLGITAKLWLRQIRAVDACHLLREGSKIMSVATQLGFRDAADFTEEF